LEVVDVRTAVAWYTIVVGALILGWWAVEVRGGVLRRPDRSRVELTLHLVAEVLTALLLIAGGAVLLGGGGPAIALVGTGMLLYTVLQSPGYFLARRETAPVVMFVVLQVTTAAAILALVLRIDR
jgi:hypothetical protein